MADDSQGAQAQLCVEPGASPHTFDGSSEPYPFVSEGLARADTLLDTNGIRGTRSHASERVRSGVYTVGGTILLHPSPADLDLWLPRILGAAESTDTFDLAETLPEFGVLIDRVAKTFEYTDCKVNRATFRSSVDGNGLLQLELDIVGKTEVEDTSFPTLTLGTADNDAPYAHHDSVVTLAGGAVDARSIEIVIDNLLEASFNNSRTATSITPQDRIVTVRTVHPFNSDVTGLYGTAAAGIDGSVVYTNGNMSTTFTFGQLQFPNESPLVSGKNSIPYTLNMTARKGGLTNELVVTHDSTA